MTGRYEPPERDDDEARRAIRRSLAEILEWVFLGVIVLLIGFALRGLWHALLSPRFPYP